MQCGPSAAITQGMEKEALQYSKDSMVAKTNPASDKPSPPNAPGHWLGSSRDPAAN